MVPYSKVIIRKSQVFSTRSYVYLNSYTQIHDRGGTMCPSPGWIGLMDGTKTKKMYEIYSSCSLSALYVSKSVELCLQADIALRRESRLKNRSRQGLRHSCAYSVMPDNCQVYWKSFWWIWNEFRGVMPTGSFRKNGKLKRFLWALNFTKSWFSQLSLVEN